MLSFIAVILDFKNPATVENILELFLEPVMHKEASLNKPWEGSVHYRQCKCEGDLSHFNEFLTSSSIFLF